MLDPKTGKVKTLQLGDGLENAIENSFAVDKDGDYVATNRKMLGLEASARTASPTVDLAAELQDSGSDQAGPVRRRHRHHADAHARRHGRDHRQRRPDERRRVPHGRGLRTAERKVCEEPVFGKGASATENSLIGVGDSLIVENNYGYDLAASRPARFRASRAWCASTSTRTSRAARSSGEQRARAERDPEGLARDRADLHVHDPTSIRTAIQAWYWTAIDFRTGKTPYKQLAGNGPALEQPLRRQSTSARTGPSTSSGFPGGLWSIKDGA